VIDSLRGLAQTLIGAVRTRLELAAAELEEQGARLAHIALYAALAGFCLALAVVLGAVLLVVLYWDSNRVAVLAILATAFGAGGIGLALAAQAAARSRPRTLAATLAELSHDVEALRTATGQKRA
jgi:uncharacterized membrane protein YqjE